MGTEVSYNVVRYIRGAHMTNETMITPSDFTPFPWIKFVMQEYGQRELYGKSANNPRILSYLATSGKFSNDETPWCSAFANWCMEQAGFRGTGKANARSWATWGTNLLSPSYGCIAVLWRESLNSAKGNVGFYAGKQGHSIWLLGGNQNNAVSLKDYPAHRLLRWRWPSEYRVP
jgi:uncharacterized protein (TIGR02594 family)